MLVATAQHDLLHAGGFLIVGAATARHPADGRARTALDSAGAGSLSVLALAALAVVMAICSAGAFIVASLTGFSLTARLTFMVVGPMVDVKLIALQAGRSAADSPCGSPADAGYRGRRHVLVGGLLL